jgi:hypothetical protein
MDSFSALPALLSAEESLVSNTDTVSVSTGSSATLQLVARWNCVAVTNVSTNPLYVTTNNVAPNSIPVDGQVTIPAGGTMVLANQLPVWTQSQSVITNDPVGNQNYRGYALEGGAANPGTTVKVLASTGTLNVTVAGCG